MTKAKESNPLRVAKGATNAQEKTTPKAAIKAVPTTEQLIKENAELKKRLASVPSKLDDRIKYFEEKKNHITQLNKLEGTELEIDENLDRISEISSENEFTNDIYSFAILKGQHSHSRTTVFKCQNPIIIGDLLLFVKAKIQKKKVELQKKIEA
jgi:predicted nuclease with TOPRIM domain